jgi:NDP-sugar pyrophosphorylase family protein
MEVLRENGIKNLVLCLSHLGEQVLRHFGDGERWGVDISYSFDGEKLLGTGGALKKAERLLQEEFFLLYGDSYLRYDYQAIKRCFEQFDKLSLLVVYRNEDRYDRSNVIIKEGMVKIYDKEHRTEDMVHIDAGLSILRKKALEFIPSNCRFDLADLYRKLARQREMLAYEVNERFYQVGSPEGLKEFENLITGGPYDSNQDTCQDSVGGWGN